MKNKKLLKALSVFAFVAVVLLITAPSGICQVDAVPEPSSAVDAANNVATIFSAQDKMVKLAISIGGAILAIIVITIGLMVYNRFFVDKHLFRSNDPNDVLNTPKTVDDAVVGFIKRNKL